jgi:hypothetical protein
MGFLIVMATWAQEITHTQFHHPSSAFGTSASNRISFSALVSPIDDRHCEGVPELSQPPVLSVSLSSGSNLLFLNVHSTPTLNKHVE